MVVPMNGSKWKFRRYEQVLAVYEGSDGNATMALYRELEKRGPIGVVAVNVFRACKSSSRAKVYRGGVPGQGSYRQMAYDRKAWAIDNLARELVENPLGMRWGWGHDPASVGFEHVLYVDLPRAGQISLHGAARGIGPDYSGRWDGIRGVQGKRISKWIADVMRGEGFPTEGEDDGIPAGAEGTSRESIEGAPGGGTQQTLDL